MNPNLTGEQKNRIKNNVRQMLIKLAYEIYTEADQSLRQNCPDLQDFDPEDGRWKGDKLHYIQGYVGDTFVQDGIPELDGPGGLRPDYSRDWGGSVGGLNFSFVTAVHEKQRDQIEKEPERKQQMAMRIDAAMRKQGYTVAGLSSPEMDSATEWQGYMHRINQVNDAVKKVITAVGKQLEGKSSDYTERIYLHAFDSSSTLAGEAFQIMATIQSYTSQQLLEVFGTGLEPDAIYRRVKEDARSRSARRNT